jgi:signal transduction histidine kinase
MKFKLLHLAAFVAVSTLFAGLGGVVATYWVVQDEVRDLLDDDLEVQAEFLAEVLSAEAGTLSASRLQSYIDRAFQLDEGDRDDLQEATWINVYDPDSGQHLSNFQHGLPLGQRGSGSVTLRFQSHDWHGYQHDQAGGPVVQLLHRADRFEEVREEVLEGVALPAVAVGAVNLALLAGLTFMALWPLTRLVKQLEVRRPDALAPLVVSTPAREVAVLQEALNGFINDVEAILSRERDFASDVAHELRTPLTTLRLELSSDSPDLAALKSEVERLIGLISQLLTLARLQRASWHEVSELVALHVLVDGLIRSLASEARTAGIPVRARSSPAWIVGDEVLLGILVRNLVDNVQRHCPAGTLVEVSVEAHADKAVLRILDNGPGVEADYLKELNAGVTRLDSRRHGSGLGISICRKIADIHHASLTLGNRQDGQSGLEIVVLIPLASRPM